MCHAFDLMVVISHCCVHGEAPFGALHPPDSSSLQPDCEGSHPCASGRRSVLDADDAGEEVQWDLAAAAPMVTTGGGGVRGGAGGD